jgi:hypothetical protein
MAGGRRRNTWLRMTDSLGLTEPGKKPEMPGPQILQFQVLGWTAMTLLWTVMLTQTQHGRENQILYGVLVIMSLVLVAINFVMLRRVTRKRADNSKVDGAG